MSGARENILGKISSAQNGTEPQPLPELIRPQIKSDLIAQFSEKLELGGGNLSQVQNPEEAVALIINFIEDHQLPFSIRSAPALKHLNWDDRLTVSYGKSDGNDLTSVTPAFCAIAETGSVLLLSGPHSPTSLNFLPDNHFVLVYASQLLPHLEDAWARVRQENSIPRTMNLITGPSKTADVEQTLQIGAHGPRQLRVILIQQD